jgi:hypothetical protein
MRVLSSMLLSCVLAAHALAGEIVLGPRAFETFPRDVQGGAIRCEALGDAPAVKAAPAGAASWGRLHLGAASYLFCIQGAPASGDVKPAALFVDADGDGDLAEEKLVPGTRRYGHMPGMEYTAFDAGPLPGTFKVGKTLLKIDLRVRLFEHAFTGWSSSGYEPVYWPVPGGLSGKPLSAELEYVKTPFRIDLAKESFRP